MQCRLYVQVVGVVVVVREIFLSPSLDLLVVHHHTMSANKIALISSNTVPVLSVQQQSAGQAESAKKMARKDKEFLWELDSQVKGIFILFIKKSR